VLRTIAAPGFWTPAGVTSTEFLFGAGGGKPRQTALPREGLAGGPVSGKQTAFIEGDVPVPRAAVFGAPAGIAGGQWTRPNCSAKKVEDACCWKGGICQGEVWMVGLHPHEGPPASSASPSNRGRADFLIWPVRPFR